MAEPAVFATTDLSALSKEVFPESDPFWDFVDQATPGLDLIERTSNIPFNGSSEGKYFVFPVRMAGSANPMVGVGTAQRGTGLPVAGKQSWQRLLYRKATHFQALEMEGDVFDSITGNPASTIDGFTAEMQNQAADARKEHNKLLHGDGSGAIAVPSNYATSTQILTVDDNSRFQVDTQFNIRADATGSLLTGQTAGVSLVVTSVNTNGTEIGIEDENGAAPGLSNGAISNHSCFRYDQQGKVINGLGIICNDADPTNWGNSGTDTLGGLSRSTFPLWQAYRHNAGGDQLDIQDDIQVFLDALKRRATHVIQPDARGVRWYAFCGYQNFRILENAMSVGQRFLGQRVKLTKDDRVYDGIEYEGANFVVDDDTPAAAIRFAAGRFLRRHVVIPWRWDDREGAIWSRRLATDGRDADIFKAYMFTRQNLYSVNNLPMGEIYNTSATS